MCQGVFLEERDAHCACKQWGRDGLRDREWLRDGARYDYLVIFWLSFLLKLGLRASLTPVFCFCVVSVDYLAVAMVACSLGASI